MIVISDSARTTRASLIRSLTVGEPDGGFESIEGSLALIAIRSLAETLHAR